MSACAAQPEPAPTGPLSGVARNAPLHDVDPADVVAARNAPEAYPASAPTRGDTSASVRVPTTPSDASEYQQGAVGLSFESTDLADQRLGSDSDDLVSIFRALNGPTLRFGGNSTDRRMFFTSDDEPAPTDWKLTEGERITRVTPSDLQRVAGFADAMGASVIVSVDLAHDDPDRAADFAEHAHEAFGDQLIGVMVGNEPNGFHNEDAPGLSVKGPGWNTLQYTRQLTAYSTAIHERVPGLRIVAPGAYSADWWDAAAASRAANPLALAVHQYPLSECGTDNVQQRPTVANAVGSVTRERVDSFVQRAAVDAASHDAPLWITETSASACVGSNAITETLASAVFQAEYSVRALSRGAERIAVHSSLAPCHGGAPMSPLCANGTIDHPGERFALRANGLALTLVASIPSGRVHPATTGTSDLTGYAVEHDDGSTTLVLSDFRDPGTAGTRTTTVTMPDGVARVTEAQLSAAEWTSEYPVDTVLDHAGQSTGPTASPASTSHGADYPADPAIGLSVEEAVRPVASGSVAVDGYGLPIAPAASRPAVAGVDAGERTFSLALPAGTTSVLTITPSDRSTGPSGTGVPSEPTGTPSGTMHPSGSRTSTRNGGQ